jgi:MFS family permease
MRDVLRTPGALSLFLASCVARLPMGALGLLIVLHTEDLTGSYTASGVATAAYAIGLGISNPLLARVIDTRGQTTVLRAGALGAASAITALAALPASVPVAGLVACAGAAGALQPPVGACMRTLWTVLLDDEDGRHAAYSLEAVVLEVVYICGPVLIVAGLGSWSLRAAIAACAVFVLVGDLAFSAHPVSRAWRPHQDRAPVAAGALLAPGVRLLVAVFALCGLAVGAVEVAVPAGLDAAGHRGLTGLVLGLWGVGSILGGFAVSRAGAPRDGARRLAWLLVAWGAAHALVGAAAGPTGFALLLLLAGVTIAPTFVCANALLDGVAPPGTLTEAFTWTSTGITAGIAAGAAVAGSLAEVATPGLALALLGLGGVAAGALVLLAPARALRPPVVA